MLNQRQWPRNRRSDMHGVRRNIALSQRWPSTSRTCNRQGNSHAYSPCGRRAVELWDQWRDPSTDQILHSYTMRTVNADDHDFMKAYYKPQDEKRMVVILPKGSYADWLTARPEQRGAFMIQYPADRLAVVM